jgi:hypothetical protein
VLGETEIDPRCSRAGCDARAVSAVNWRNPRIHGPERVKVWLACDEHTSFLRDYLTSRNFPVEVSAADAPVAQLSEASA